MNNTSKTDWARIDAMHDKDIDTSDIPPLTEKFFAKAKLRSLNKIYEPLHKPYLAIAKINCIPSPDDT